MNVVNSEEGQAQAMGQLAALFNKPAAPPSAASKFDPRSIPVRHSRLKLIGRSPAHYRYGIEHGLEDTLPMRLGRAVHLLLLGGVPQLIVFQGAQRRGKAWDAFKELYPSSSDGEQGYEILLEKELATAEAMASAVRLHPDAMRLLEGEHELKLEWTLAGRKCTARLDVAGDGFVTDLKSAVDAKPERFQQVSIGMGYYSQLAWYLDGAAQVLAPRSFDRAFIVSVESKPPHVVTPYEISPNALEFGRKTARLWFEQLLVCEASDTWPGYLDGIGRLDVAMEEDGLDLLLPEDDEEQAA